MAFLDQLYRIVRDLIDTRREGDYWDFKQSHHTNKADLIHMILFAWLTIVQAKMDI